MAKSQIRKNADSVMNTTRHFTHTAWTDTGSTGARVKYHAPQPTPQELADMFVKFQALYPNNPVAVYYKPASHVMAYSGVCFKVFNDARQAFK
jgi:hypothetical protein